MKKLNTQSNTKNEFKKNIMKAALIASMLAGTVVVPFSNNLKRAEVIQVNAAYGDNQGGNAESVTWGGKFFSWKLTVDGKPAYCINLGLPPTTGQEMEKRETDAYKNPIMIRFVSAAYGRNITGLQQKYGLSDHDAWKASIYVAHVVENLIGYGPQVEKLTETEFRALAAEEGVVGQYAIELLEFAKNGKLPNAAIAITEPSTKLAKYNAATNRLETQVYTVNDVESTNILVKGLPQEIYMIDATSGQKVTVLAKNQTFKLVTDKLDYTAQLSQIVANAGVQDHAAVIWKYEGVQDLIQSETIDPLDSAAFTAEFKSVLGNIQFTKMNVTSKTPLEGMKFNLLTKDGKTVASAVSDKKGQVIFSNILEGEYTVKEVSVKGDGFVDNDKSYPVKVVASKTVDLNGIKEIDNAETTTKISKSDLTNGKCVANAHLQIVDKNGKVVVEWNSDCATPTKEINKLAEGDYVLKETVAPGRYQFTNEMKFSVKENGAISKVEMHDDRTRLIVNKLDGTTKKPLEGAKFGVYTQSGELTKMLDKDGKEVDAIAVSDKDGKAVFEGLLAGDYVVKEIESPFGYTTNSDMHITVGQKGETIRDFANYEIPKKPRTPEKPKTPEVPRTPIFNLPMTGGAESGLETLIAGGGGLGAGLLALIRKFKK